MGVICGMDLVICSIKIIWTQTRPKKVQVRIENRLEKE